MKDLVSETSNNTNHNSIYKTWNNYRRKRDANFERYKILGWKVRWKITAVQWDKNSFILNAWQNLRYAILKPVQNSFLLPEHHSSTVFTNCTWQIIWRQNIVYYCQCNMNCCSVSHAKNHQHHIKSLSDPHNTMQKKIYIPRVWFTLVKTVSNNTTKYTEIFLTWSHKWRVQNKTPNLQRVYTMRQNYYLL